MTEIRVRVAVVVTKMAAITKIPQANKRIIPTSRRATWFYARKVKGGGRFRHGRERKKIYYEFTTTDRQFHGQNARQNKKKKTQWNTEKNLSGLAPKKKEKTTWISACRTGSSHKKKKTKFYQQTKKKKNENYSMARARLLTPNVAICSADERMRLIRLLRYSNKQIQDK